MMLPRRHFLQLAAGAASLATLPATASAQSWPARTITLVVPFPAGGGVDTIGRVVAERLSVALKQSVMVDNRGGAGGTIGTRSVAKAEADGYTLLLGHTGTMSINPSLYANAGYDPRKDFAPVGLIASMPVVLIAHPSFPAKTVADVIALAKKEPGKLNFGSPPVGTGGHLTAEYFKSAAGIDMQIIPYRGTAPLMNDLVGGHVLVAFGVLPPAIGNIQAGSLRAITVTGTKRLGLLPDVPTADESGLPGFELGAALRARGACRHPARDCRPAQQGARRHPENRRDQATHSERRRRHHHVVAGGIRQGHRPGRGEVVGLDQEA